MEERKKTDEAREELNLCDVNARKENILISVLGEDGKHGFRCVKII